EALGTQHPGEHERILEARRRKRRIASRDLQQPADSRQRQRRIRWRRSGRAREQPRHRDESEGNGDEEQLPPRAQQQASFTRRKTNQTTDSLSYRFQSVAAPPARGPKPGGPRRLAAR